MQPFRLERGRVWQRSQQPLDTPMGVRASPQDRPGTQIRGKRGACVRR